MNWIPIEKFDYSLEDHSFLFYLSGVGSYNIPTIICGTIVDEAIIYEWPWDGYEEAERLDKYVTHFIELVTPYE